jgi:transposase
MAKRRFEVTQEQDKELQRAYRDSRDSAERTRYQAVRLYGKQYAVEEICQITGCNRTSLMDWCCKYRAQGVGGLQDHRGGPVRAKLSRSQVQEVADKLRTYRPRDGLGGQTQTASGEHWTITDLAQALERWYGVSWLSRVSYHSLLLRCDFSYQRTEKVYKSRRERDIAEFQAKAEKN